MPISEKFRAAFDTDPDTRVLSRTQVSIGGRDGLIEMWSWDGQVAGSVIFCKADITGLDEQDIIELACKGSDAFSRGKAKLVDRSDSGYIFVNFHP